MVWDIGTYELLEGTFAKGHLRFRLEGHKLKGEWLLTRSSKPGRETWYLIKVGTDMSPVSKKQDDTSAISRRSMNQIAKEAA
jgi:bifunctional non-homologous end joining protein LigD